MSDPKEREMSVDEAIYCMTSYLPDNSVEHCVNCPYYAIKEQNFGDQCFYVCRSSEAHELAIKALKKLKEVEDSKSKGENTIISGTVHNLYKLAFGQGFAASEFVGTKEEFLQECKEKFLKFVANPEDRYVILAGWSTEDETEQTGCTSSNDLSVAEDLAYKWLDPSIHEPANSWSNVVKYYASIVDTVEGLEIMSENGFGDVVEEKENG